jgi:hypothetical protein
MQTHDNGQIQFMRKPIAGETRTMHIFGKVQRVTILAVHQFGTVDIETESGKCFRISGLSFL